MKRVVKKMCVALVASVMMLSIAYLSVSVVRASNPPAAIRAKICETASSKIGCTYKNGASGPKEFDCGGLVRYCANIGGVTLEADTAAENFREFRNMYRAVLKTSTNYNRKLGDFIYYKEFDDKGKVIDNGRYMYIYHAAVYIGGDTIIDATSRAGKVVKRSRSTTFKPRSEVGYAYCI